MSNLIVVSLIAIANAVNAVGRADRLDDGCPYQPGDGSAMFCTGRGERPAARAELLAKKGGIWAHAASAGTGTDL